MILMRSVFRFIWIFQGSTLFDFFVEWPWYHPWYTMASPRHPMAWYRIPWPRRGYRGMVPWQPLWQPPRHSMATSRHVIATPMAPQCPRHLGLGLSFGFHGMPRRSVEGSVVCHGQCRGRVCRRWCHGMSRKRTIMYMPRVVPRF